MGAIKVLLLLASVINACTYMTDLSYTDGGHKSTVLTIISDSVQRFKVCFFSRLT